MKTLLYYLAQAIITSGILYTWYHFALRNNKFHRYNRFYLLAATVISITIPFLNIPVYFTQTETDSSFVLQALTVFSPNGSDEPLIAVTRRSNQINWFTWENLSYCFYILIASIALIRIIFSLLKIRRIARNNPVEQLDNIRFINTSEPGTPFSFFRWLFWNRQIELNSEKGEQVFRHELFHIKQKHSLDIMYMELLTAIFWINPFFHLMKKEAKAIHEFLADQFAVTENTKWQYAELLLMQILNTNQHLVNPFFHNQIKRRIAMITTSKKPSYQYLKKLMIFPVTAIIIGIFAFSYKQKNEANKSGNKFISEITVADTTKPIKISEVILTDKKSSKDADKIFDKVEIEATFPGGDRKWREYVEKILNGNIPTMNKAPVGTYTTIAIFIVDKEGNISDVKALTAHGFGMEEEVIRVIKNGPKWLPAIQNGRQVTAYRRQPITFVVRKSIQNDDDPSMIFNKVEIPPTFPGGDAAWGKYLQSNINPLVPVDSGAPAGTYKVIVQFIVAKDGSISDIKCNTSHGFGMENEAMRMIRMGPKWNPATQNGRIVTAYVQQPVTFQISEEVDDDPIKVNESSTISEISVSTLNKIGVYELLQLAYGTEILSYQFTIDNDNGTIVEVPNTGSQFNFRTKMLIAKATAGKILTIDMIRIKENGVEKKIPSKAYKVVN